MRSPKRSSLRNMPPPRSTGKNAPRFNRRLKNNSDKIDKRDIDTSVKLKKENTKQRIVKLTEKDIESLVGKILKEELSGDAMRGLANLHDDVLYLTPEFDGMGGAGRSIEVFEDIMDIVSVGEMPDEAKALVRRIEYDLSSLDGTSGRIVELYNMLTDDEI